MAVPERDADARVAELLRAGWSREALPLGRRRLLTEIVFGGAFLAAALALGLLADAERDVEPLPALLLVALFALAIRVNIDVGAGYTSPVQVVFVPMLLLLPTPWVPLLVAAGWLAGRLPDLRGARVHADRLLLVLGNSWFAVGPALVLVLAGAQTPDWSDSPWYLVALASQVGLDLAMSTLREWLGEGIAPALQVRVVALVHAIDAMLSPLGLLAAFASVTWDYAFLLVVPPTGMLVFYAHERTRRLRSALALADAARSRQELIAGASHEFVTPLAVLLALSDRLAPGRTPDPTRQAEVHRTMHRELLRLRQLVRVFVDYTRLKTGRALRLDARPAPVEPVVAEVAAALGDLGTIETDVPPDLTPALVDPGRLHQMLMALVSETLRLSPAPPRAHIRAGVDGDRLTVTVTGQGTPGPAPWEEGSQTAGAGLGLYITRRLALAQGGDVAVETGPDGGGCFVLALPRAQ